MNILAHRGWWQDKDERNSLRAIERALAAGYGVETDIRDCAGAIVVSHDPPRGGEATLEALLEVADRHAGSGMLALNVKADGLQSMLEPLVRDRRDYFLFDMSVPDLRTSLRRGLTCFTRQSDIETQAVLLDEAAGVWLDGFGPSAPNVASAASLVDAGKCVAFVSPELHGRNPDRYWSDLRDTGLHQSPLTMLCTDHPDRAAKYFASAK